MFGSCKVGKVVEFPLRSQDFGRWTTSGEPALYDLVGFVVHEGRSLEFGHYVSYCRHEQDNQWYKFDDMVVTRCDATQVAKSQPYILMYRKHTTNGEPSISQNTESPFNFFASRRLFSDRDSEAWDVIRKCLDEDGKEKKVAGSSRKNIRKKKKRMTKQQITDILKKASIDDVEQHYKALQQIMDDIVKSLSQKDPNRDKNKASQDASKEALNNLVISMETWFKVMIKKKWVERRLEEERELDETHRLLYQDESIPNTSG